MRRNRFWLQLVLPVAFAIGLLAGLERTLAFLSEAYQDWRMASCSQEGLKNVGRAVAELQEAVQAAKTDTVTVRAVPTLSEVEELVWQFDLTTRRAERTTTISKQQYPTAQYTVALCGPATDLVTFLHSLETTYLCRLAQTTLQRADETGGAVLTMSLEVAE